MPALCFFILEDLSPFDALVTRLHVTWSQGYILRSFRIWLPSLSSFFITMYLLIFDDSGFSFIDFCRKHHIFLKKKRKNNYQQTLHKTPCSQNLKPRKKHVLSCFQSLFWLTAVPNDVIKQFIVDNLQLNT